MVKSNNKLMALIVLLLFLSLAQAAEPDSQSSSSMIEYHGFHINTFQLSEDQRATVLPSILKQLDIVESVGLPVDVLRFLRGVPLAVDASMRGNPGQYTNQAGSWLVAIRPMVFPENKPILLHELLHAYHFKVLTLNNQEILDAYQKAKQSDMYPSNFQSSHFLENAKEYFAITGTVYLFGAIQQPPFNCDVLSRSEPEYVAFMTKTFGTHTCH